MGLTPHQQEKLDESLEILKVEDRLLIKGSAGVGKTFLVNTLIKRLVPSLFNGKICCSAPTNKAVAVIKGKVEEINNLEFNTVHSALKIKRQINYKTGKITFKPSYSDKYPPLKGVRLLIIDEASMLNSELLDFVEIHAKKNRCKVIFLGDEKQLNPVGEDVSPVFLGQPFKFETRQDAEDALELSGRKGVIKEYLDKYILYIEYPNVELTEIVRQGEGNPIINLSRNLSQIKKSKQDNRTNLGGYMYSNDFNRVIATLAAVNGTDELKYLGYTNAEVDKINSCVRKAIYGENPSKIEVDETLVFNEPFGEGSYFTNQEIKVESVEVKERNFQYPSGKSKDGFTKVTTYNDIKLKYYSINPVHNSTTGEKDENIIVIHEDSEKDYKKLLKNLGSMCTARIIDWIDYYKFKETFADLKYNHAITVHKSQGSTYKQAIVNVKNININRNSEERKRLLYTAVTRASKLLILYKV